MENEKNLPIDYDAVLAQLLAQREDLDKAIAAISRISGKEVAVGSPTAVNNTGSVSAEIRSDTFFGMTIPDAARKLLKMKKQPLNAPKIAEYLSEGGFKNTSAKFSNTVGSVLNRLANTEGGDIVKVDRGSFGLLEWYPGFRRGKPKKNGEEDDNGSEKKGDKK